MKIYQVDAFTDTVFSGNPAAVCPLDTWLDDKTLQNIAAENNLAETAFFVKTNEGFHIRWFTPKAEVDLCGHATLATAYVLFQEMGYSDNTLSFDSRSRILTVTKNQEWLTLNFPVDQFHPIELTSELISCFDSTPTEAYKGLTDYMLVFPHIQDIQTINPDLSKIALLDARGVIVTAKGTDTDFVSRFFAPAVGVNEDPVTGSAHTTLAPYWSAQLRKTELTARQISERGGYLRCKLINDRVEISGQAALYLTGEISI